MRGLASDDADIDFIALGTDGAQDLANGVVLQADPDEIYSPGEPKAQGESRTAAEFMPDSSAVTERTEIEVPVGDAGVEPQQVNEAPTERPRLSSIGVRALADSTDGPGSGLTGGASSRFFGLAAEDTHSVVYVIDCSGSMGRPRVKLQLAKEELVRSIRELQAEQSFYVVFFSDQMFPMPFPGLLSASDANKDRVCAWVDGALSGGGTNPFPAVAHALQLHPETIYVLSDGLFRGEYVRAIRGRNRGPRRANIYTIGFGDRRGEPQLIRLARENGGNYRYVEPGAP